MSGLPLSTWHPASFVEHARSLERDEFLETYGAGLFLLVALRGEHDPIIATLAASSKLLDRMRLARTAPNQTTGIRTHSQLESMRPEALVPVAVTREPRFLVWVEPASEGSDRAIVGRSSDADVLLRHTSVSKRHAAFLLDQVGAVGLCDLGSKNGTLVNGERLEPSVRHEVENGDELRFGNLRALLYDAAALWRAIAG